MISSRNVSRIWLLNTEFSLHSIKAVMDRVSSLGYTIFIYSEDLIDKKVLNTEEAARCAFEGNNKSIGEFPIFYLAQQEETELSIFFLEKDGKLEINSGIDSYEVEVISKPDEWIEIGWDRIANDFRRYQNILGIYRILKCRFEQEQYMQEPARELGKNIPAISVFSGLMLQYPEDRVLFLQNLIGRGYEIKPAAITQANEQTYTIARNTISGTLIIRPNQGDYWFVPATPYKMRQYENEYAIDTASYIEFAFDMCPVPISVLETEDFDITSV